MGKLTHKRQNTSRSDNVMHLLKKPNVGNFEPLFNKSVPHILESIFFSLDTDTFAKCGKVCKSWNELFSSRAYQEKLEDMLEEKERKRKEEELCIYSEVGRVDIVRKLLTEGVDINCRSQDDKGRTPLALAFYNGKRAVVNILLNAGADPNIMFRNGLTILHCAVIARDIDTIKRVLEAGADPNISNKFGESPLSWATMQDVVKLLLNSGADLRGAKLSNECKGCAIMYCTENDLFLHRYAYHM